MNNDIKRYGISILLVNSEKCKPGEIDSIIEEIFDIYRKTLYALDQKPFSEEKSSGYYYPVKIDLLGYFDKAYLFLNEGFELTTRYLHPGSVLSRSTDSSEVFNFKITPGSIAFPKEKTSLSIFNDIQEQRETNKYICISRAKVNSRHLFKGGGKVIGKIKSIINDIYKKHNQSNTKGVFIVESFGFHEFIILSFWNSYESSVKFLMETRELQISNPDFGDCMPFTDQNSFPVFDVFSTNFGLLSDEGLSSENFDLFTGIGLKPGRSVEFFSILKKEFEGLDELDFHSMHGWLDCLIPNFYKKIGDIEKIRDLMLKLQPLTDRVHTNIYSKANPKTKLKNSYRNVITELINKGDLIETESKEEDLTKKFLIKNAKIKEVEYYLKELNLNYVVIQRLINSIINFNKCISERDNFPYFIRLKEYIDVILIDFVKESYELYFLDSVSEFFNIYDFENELILRVKGFETAFSNRYIHSRELAETSDINYAYKGGIQQYLVIYEYLFHSMHQFIFGKSKPGVSLYVSAYSHTLSWNHIMRMNIFQVYNPGLFLVVLAHEVSIHLFQKLIIECFGYKINGTSQEFKFLQKFDYDTQKILNGLQSLGMYDVQNQNPFMNFVFLNHFKFKPESYQIDPSIDDNYRNNEVLKYLLTDKLTYHITFFKNLDLFVYWHLYFFFQLYGPPTRQKPSRDYSQYLTTQIIRFYMLFSFLKKDLTNNELTESLKSALNKVVDTSDFIEEFNCAVKYAREIIDYGNTASKTNVKPLEFLLFLYETIAQDTDVENSFEGYDLRHFHKIPFNLLKEPEKDFLSTDAIRLEQRKCNYSYLKCYYEVLPKIGWYSSFNENPTHQNQTVYIDPNGGIHKIGEEKRELIYMLKQNYLQNIWHLSYLSKGLEISSNE
ncbi:MAG: hypothetical protein R2879_21735 [Saprospiraceae bacterium]